MRCSVCIEVEGQCHNTLEIIYINKFAEDQGEKHDGQFNEFRSMSHRWCGYDESVEGW